MPQMIEINGVQYQLSPIGNRDVSPRFMSLCVCLGGLQGFGVSNRVGFGYSPSAAKTSMLMQLFGYQEPCMFYRSFELNQNSGVLGVSVRHRSCFDANGTVGSTIKRFLAIPGMPMPTRIDFWTRLEEFELHPRGLTEIGDLFHSYWAEYCPYFLSGDI